MKRRYLQAIMFTCLVASIGYAEDFRIFTASDGRVIEARIVEYNPGRKKLRIERSNGNSVWVEPRIFSEEDRTYILAWIQAADFLTSSRVRISIERHKKSSGRSGDDIHYSILIQNRMDSSLNDLVLDYRFYVEGKGYQGRPDKERCVQGSIKLDFLAAGEKKVLETALVRMVEDYETYTESSTDYYGNTTYSTYQRKVYDEDARGVWLRISGPKLEGKPLVREEWYPKELNKRVNWIESPVKSGGSLASMAGHSQNKRTEAIALKKQAIACRNAKGNERDIPKAIELYKQAYALYEEPYTAFEIGNLYLWEKPFRSFALAEEWLQLAVKKKFSRAHLCLAEYYYRGYDTTARDGSLAVYHAQTAAELEKNESRVFRVLASAYAFNGQFKEAVKAQEKAIELFSVTDRTQRYYNSLKATLREYQDKTNLAGS